MILQPTKLAGVWVVEPELIRDERGFFARTHDRAAFEQHGLEAGFVQCSLSYNWKRGTLRGMHYQIAPFGEAKLVRCTMGAIFDVALDLRPDQPTFKQWLAVDLTAENRRALYLPPGVAHGFQTLVDGSEVFYQIAEFYHVEAARGVRWDDPAFGIAWPAVETRILSERDRQYPDFLE